MPVSIGSFATVDIIAAAIILLFSIIGVSKGFVKQILSLVGGIVVIIASILTFKYVYDFLLKFDFFNNWVVALGNKMSGINLGFLSKIAAEAGKTQGLLVSEYIFKLITFILLCIVYSLIYKIIKKMLCKIVKLPVINIFDKILGLALGFCWGLIVVGGLVFLVYLLKDKASFANNFINNYIPSTSYVKKFIVDNMETIKTYFMTLVDFIKGKVSGAI